MDVLRIPSWINGVRLASTINFYANDFFFSFFSSKLQTFSYLTKKNGSNAKMSLYHSFLLAICALTVRLFFFSSFLFLLYNKSLVCWKHPFDLVFLLIDRSIGARRKKTEQFYRRRLLSNCSFVINCCWWFDHKSTWKLHIDQRRIAFARKSDASSRSSTHFTFDIDQRGRLSWKMSFINDGSSSSQRDDRKRKRTIEFAPSIDNVEKSRKSVHPR